MMWIWMVSVRITSRLIFETMKETMNLISKMMMLTRRTMGAQELMMLTMGVMRMRFGLQALGISRYELGKNRAKYNFSHTNKRNRLVGNGHDQ